MPNPVVHFEIISADAPKLRQFYQDTFGWQINADNPFDYGMVNTGEGAGINGAIGSPMPGGQGGHLTFYIAVPDVDAALAKVVAGGGRVLLPKVTVPPDGPTIAQFADPQGHRIGVIQSGSMG
jgi:predicted enzyme related to lactoylglutathione lyase